jgi:hypothetical protein
VGSAVGSLRFTTTTLCGCAVRVQIPLPGDHQVSLTSRHSTGELEKKWNATWGFYDRSAGPWKYLVRVLGDWIRRLVGF